MCLPFIPPQRLSQRQTVTFSGVIYPIKHPLPGHYAGYQGQGPDTSATQEIFDSSTSDSASLVSRLGGGPPGRRKQLLRAGFVA